MSIDCDTLDENESDTLEFKQLDSSKVVGMCTTVRGHDLTDEQIEELESMAESFELRLEGRAAEMKLNNDS